MNGQLDKENINRLSDDQLRAKLKECGITYGPILPSTRSLYEKKLLNFLTTGNTTFNTTANMSVLADTTLNKTNNKPATTTVTAASMESPRTRRQTTHKEIECDNTKTVVEKVVTTTTTTTTKTPKKVVEIEPVVNKTATTTSRKEINYETIESRQPAKSLNDDIIGYSSNLMNISELRNLPSLGDESYIRPNSRSQPVKQVETMNKHTPVFTQESHYAPRKVIEAEPIMAPTMSPSKIKISSTSNNTYRLIDSNPINNGIVFSATSTLARPVKHSEAALLSEEPIPQPPQRHKIGSIMSERPNLMQEEITKPYIPLRLPTQPMNSMTPDKFASRLNEYGMLKTSLNNDLVSKSTSSIRSRPPMHKENMFTTSGLATTATAAPTINTVSSKPTMTRSESTTVSSSSTDKKTDQIVSEKTGWFSSKLGYSILVVVLTSLVYLFFMMLQTNPTDPMME